MADFCKQCAEEMGLPNGMEYLQTVFDTNDGLVTEVICEGCGHTYVDHTGKCVAPGCLRDHTIPVDEDEDYLEKVYKPREAAAAAERNVTK